MSTTPTVAIVGRPNVGKSTLFNRLVGRRLAIVHNAPGVTRDRVFARTTIDNQHDIFLVDTGGLLFEADTLGLNQQVEAAIEESDVLLLVVDGKAGRTSGDDEVAARLRRTGKPTLVIVNKADTRQARDQEADFFVLGFDGQVLLSAEHGIGFDDLHDQLGRLLPRAQESDELIEDHLPRLAIVGRPNVGKSSLLNRIVGSDRALVSDQAGTTRDPIDTVVEVGGTPYRLIDTAGIRRRAKTSGAAEELAIMMAERQLERADIALLVIDAADGVTTGDLAIAGAATRQGCGVVALVNKWDLLDDESRHRLEDDWPRLAELTGDPERVNVSALTGRGIERIFPAVESTLECFRRRLGTAEVNRLVESLVARHQAPHQQGRPWKVYYATQAASAPPTFVLFANRALPRQSSYRRYLENAMQRELGLRGVRARIRIRQRDRR